jgi:hypothetical protein
MQISNFGRSMPAQLIPRSVFLLPNERAYYLLRLFFLFSEIRFRISFVHFDELMDYLRVWLKCVYRKNYLTRKKSDNNNNKKTFFSREREIYFIQRATHIDHPRILMKHWSSSTTETLFSRSLSLTLSLSFFSIYVLACTWVGLVRRRQDKAKKLALNFFLFCAFILLYTLLARSILSLSHSLSDIFICTHGYKENCRRRRRRNIKYIVSVRRSCLSLYE